jgi:hypothetical protein
MPSSWVLARATKKDGRNKGRPRYRVLYRLGGREISARYARSFATKAEAVARKRWVDGELAALRVPVLAVLVEPAPSPTLRVIAERWTASRVDVSDATLTYHRSALNRAEPLLDRAAHSITAADVAELVGELADAGKARETIRKTVTVCCRWCSTTPASRRTRRATGSGSACRVRSGRRSHRRRASTYLRFTGCSRPHTACRLSCSMRPACASGSYTLSPGATSTS